jgi:hypothetical protein
MVVCLLFTSLVSSLSISNPPSKTAALSASNDGSTTILQAKSQQSAWEEAQELLERSRVLREEIALQEGKRRVNDTTKDTTTTPVTTSINKWSVPLSVNQGDIGNTNAVEYRLYVDIGREPGTWMEPLWGASGRRIEFTLDVKFYPSILANKESAQKIVQDNLGGSSSPVHVLESAPLARLRSGFDEMVCQGGAFRLDKSNQPGKKSDTLRFYVTVEGLSKSSYGDVSIPPGALYFSVPCFGSVQRLSSKGEMPVTLRQMGWHTGWRREESRIVGVFRAVPIEDARRRDRF